MAELKGEGEVLQDFIRHSLLYLRERTARRKLSGRKMNMSD